MVVESTAPGSGRLNQVGWSVPPPKKDTRKGLLTMIMDMPPMPVVSAASISGGVSPRKPGVRRSGYPLWGERPAFGRIRRTFLPDCAYTFA
jgi:hypothetical protein